MKLKTGLQLSAVFPLLFAIVMTLSIRWWLSSDMRSEWLDTVFLAVTGVVGLVMGAVILTYSRDILHKIKVLNEWTNSVLQGNLDEKIDLKPSNDEVGRLSQALGAMLHELKAAYGEAIKESAEHKARHQEEKRRADASRIATKGLSAAIERYRESQQELMQKERLHVIETVLKGVVHDVGDAMAPIQGTLDILQVHPDKLNDRTESRRHLKTISIAVENVRRLLKSQTGIFQAYRERLGPADLNVLVQRAVDILEPRWKAEANMMGKSIEVRRGFKAVPMVVGDEVDLRDAVMHLVLNAVEAMPKGGTITLSTYSDKSNVTLEVCDTGEGMSAEVLERCMEPFFTTKGSAGTGMGLAIAGSVVRRYNGSLQVESEVGKGTRIVVKLPIWAETSRDRAEAEHLSDASRNLSILLVDDNALSRVTASECLSSLGHTVMEASSGPEGIQLLRVHTFDVAIVDRAMPGMAGDELARIIKESVPNLPVIMLTAYADIMHEENSILPCIDFMLSKPARLSDMENALAQVMPTVCPPAS